MTQHDNRFLDPLSEPHDTAMAAVLADLDHAYSATPPPGLL